MQAVKSRSPVVSRWHNQSRYAFVTGNFLVIGKVTVQCNGWIVITLSVFQITRSILRINPVYLCSVEVGGNRGIELVVFGASGFILRCSRSISFVYLWTRFVFSPVRALVSILPSYLRNKMNLAQYMNQTNVSSPRHVNIIKQADMWMRPIVCTQWMRPYWGRRT